MNVNGRNILFFGWNFKLLVDIGLINNTIIFQIRIHVQYFAFPLPCVTLSMDIDLLISVKDLPNCFFSWHLELILCIAKSIDNSDKLWFFSQLTDTIALVLPPRNRHTIISYVKVKIFSIWNVTLFITIFVDKCTRPSCLVIKPWSNITSCCFYDWVDFWWMPVFLY